MSEFTQLLDHAKMLHEGQIDKTGSPYWLHCARVLGICEAMSYVISDKNFSTREMAVVAVFHDVLEDVPDGEEKLKNILASNEFDAAIPRLRLLTKPDDTPYGRYIDNILSFGDKIVLLVKLADMIDHIRRLPFIKDDATQKRLQEKYREPYRMLREKFAEMRAQRLRHLKDQPPRT